MTGELLFFRPLIDICWCSSLFFVGCSSQELVCIFLLLSYSSDRFDVLLFCYFLFPYLKKKKSGNVGEIVFLYNFFNFIYSKNNQKTGFIISRPASAPFPLEGGKREGNNDN